VDGFGPVPKIVLTASPHEEDERRATKLGCSAYFVKPEQLAGLVKLVSAMNEDWISVHCPIAAS